MLVASLAHDLAEEARFGVLVGVRERAPKLGEGRLLVPVAARPRNCPRLLLHYTRAMPVRETPGPHQESVWDYPRPPRIEPTSRRIRVVLGGVTIADTTRALRVLETSHPPVYYVPITDVTEGVLVGAARSTVCEFKGAARYFDVRGGQRLARAAAWTYDEGPLAGHVAFYARPMDACFVDDEQATPQEGDFYGGWITSHVVGPFKGGPGTLGW